MEYRESDPDAERHKDVRLLEALMAELQFQSTGELDALRQQIITAHAEQDAPGVIEALSSYQDLAGEATMAIEDVDESRAYNLGLNISTAALWLECGDTEPVCPRP